MILKMGLRVLRRAGREINVLQQTSLSPINSTRLPHTVGRRMNKLAFVIFLRFALNENLAPQVKSETSAGLIRCCS
jgi:hypothetical protein